VTLAETVLDWRLAAAGLACAVAGLMRGYSGFGTAILLGPVFATLYGPRAGVPLLLAMEMLVSLQLVPSTWRQAEARVVWPLALGACLAIPLGALVLLAADQDLLRRAMGALVLALGMLLMSSWRYRGARPLPLNLGVGALAGVLKGATGMSGPVVILYMLAGTEGARIHRANLILFFGIIGLVAIIPPLWAGLLDVTLLLRGAILLPVLLVCVRFGARLFHVVPQILYRRIALMAVILTGLIALLAP
jgi:hypothetical protein